MNRYLLPSGLVLASWLAIDHLLDQERRILELERAPRVDPARVEELATEIETARADLSSEVTGKVSETREELDRQTSADRERLAQLERLLSTAEEALKEHDSRLASWQDVWSGHEPEQLEGSVSDLRAQVEERWRALDEAARSAARIADEDRVRLAQIDQVLAPLTAARDNLRKWDDLLGPVVQLFGDTTVGSGILLESRELPEGGWRTFVLTAWHVVRDIYGNPDETDGPVEVKLYGVDGNVAQETAHLVAHDADLDLALLTLDRTTPVAHGARLPPRSRLARVKIFDPVYAVGCPLGNDPIPTAGEIASTHHEVEGGHYWMISAPTYIGNSGGGIFDAETHELLAIFSKIYTHGSMRSTIVPHMGLATPLGLVYDWLEVQGFAYLEPAALAQTQTASSKH